VNKSLKHLLKYSQKYQFVKFQSFNTREEVISQRKHSDNLKCKTHACIHIY